MWLMSNYCYVFVGVLIQAIRVVLVHAADSAEIKCSLTRDDPVEVKKCVEYFENKKNSSTFFILFETAIWLGMRIWFILNIRDWRDIFFELDYKNRRITQPEVSP